MVLPRSDFFWEGASVHTHATIKPCRRSLCDTGSHVRVKHKLFEHCTLLEENEYHIKSGLSSIFLNSTIMNKNKQVNQKKQETISVNKSKLNLGFVFV